MMIPAETINQVVGDAEARLDAVKKHYETRLTALTEENMALKNLIMRIALEAKVDEIVMEEFKEQY